MKIEQIYTGCLSEASYYIESDGEAAVIDPLRDVHPYLLRANKDKAKIRYIFQTHFHADFISGHRELGDKVKATIVYGPTATPGYKAHVSYDGEAFRLGNIRIKVLHTPGHSLESVSYLLIDAHNRPHALFTGDTLFINGVGRTDLAQQVRAEMTPQFMAGLLYDALHNKILPLPDDIVIYPGHGRGSPCGRDMDESIADTLGNQRKSNPALDPALSRDAFVESVQQGLPELPAYFPFNILGNQSGDMPTLEKVLSLGTHRLSPKDFRETWSREQALVIDTRDLEAFVGGHIPGAVSVPFSSSFHLAMGRLVEDLRTPILLVSAPEETETVVLQLARTGYQQMLGCLRGGIKSWAQMGWELKRLEGFVFPGTVPEPLLARGSVLLDIRLGRDDHARLIPGVVPIGPDPRAWKKLDPGREYVLMVSDADQLVSAYAQAVRAGLPCSAFVWTEAAGMPSYQA